jgi:hypothetical protein
MMAESHDDPPAYDADGFLNVSRPPDGTSYHALVHYAYGADGMMDTRIHHGPPSTGDPEMPTTPEGRRALFWMLVKAGGRTPT